ncbi:hypothetical protein OAH93_00800 [Flavobacteriales bacterium]|nr:hypothetical protein [Porticoccaceae bacterium]MDB4676161.1 hypothetical protein [Flavobacteriales bacterium]
MSNKNITIGNETRLMTAEEEARWSELNAETKVLDDAKAVEVQTQEDLKVSAKTKLIAGEALTEDEANILIGV